MNAAPPATARHHLLAAGAVIALNAGVLGWCLLNTEQRQAELDQLTRHNTALIEQVQRRTADAADSVHLRTALHTWQQRGLIGPENRSHWRAVLNALQQEIGLPALRHEFGPAVAGVDGRPGSTPLYVHLDLLHEEDLLHLLDALSGRLQALPVVRSCRLARTAGRLGADCRIDLITSPILPDR